MAPWLDCAYEQWYSRGPRRQTTPRTASSLVLGIGVKMLNLLKYRVQGFRSVVDSGWIDTGPVTALIGVNESGKTNLLLPLWKSNPAKDGKIKPLEDYPRSAYTELRKDGSGRVFVSAVLETDPALRTGLAKITGLPEENFGTVEIDRRFDGKYHVRFPSVVLRRTADGTALTTLLNSAKVEMQSERFDEVACAGMVAAIAAAEKRLLGSSQAIDASGIDAIQELLEAAPIGDSATDEATTKWKSVCDSVASLGKQLGLVHPNDSSEARQLVVKHLPSFVYYSNYGNLDSEIYLPHVIKNLSREEKGEDIGAKEAAKARTLRVLFDFVGLKPEEILELGKALEAKKDPSAAEIALAAEKTKERSVLLQSAGAKLTKEFRNWWKQGNYRFRFEADGDHFRIWVSDELRPDEVELEARSTGLQWFLSFFLVFLVESQDAHDGAILLLDEPGLSLHPLAQRDLRDFFDSLAGSNQLLFTTHSPFLVDPDRLDQVRSIYVDESGATVSSSDLRAGKPNSPEFKSVYAVHSALGLSVSEALLQGCTNVVVEGASDQLYLSAVKTVLIALQKIHPQRELLFLPGGGAKGVVALVPIVAGKDDAPPHVILDSDPQGLLFAKKLREGSIYEGSNAQLIQNVGELVGFENAEVEDLMPQSIVAAVVARMFRGDPEFDEICKEGEPIVPQIQAHAASNAIVLEQGWKVDLARAVKQKVVASPDKVPAEIIEVWMKLFSPFTNSAKQKASSATRRR